MSAVLASPAATSPWRGASAILVLALAAVLLLYRESFEAMVAIWSRSDTFAHAFLVPPISLWLVWRRRDMLRPLVPRAAPWFLLPVALTAFAWLIGDLAGVNTLTQLAATTLIVLTVPAVLGTGVARAIAFPLTFLFFMVPLGEFAIPFFMQWTADVTVFTLKALGVPVYREGLSFVIPSGSWSVVEACSGVRYLIASFMVGTLFAYLQYRSTRRRLLFALVSMVVPVAANWVRAVLIVMLGHLSDNRLATGADHLIYGWVFFGLVVGLMFFLGARWSEPLVAQSALRQAAPAAAREWSPTWNVLVVAALVGTLALPPAVAGHAHGDLPRLPELKLPDLSGVQANDGLQPLHTPHFEGARAQASRNYTSGGETITVHVAYYRQQTYGRKLASSENAIVRSEDRRWRLVAQGTQELSVGGRSLTVRTAALRSGALAAQTATEQPLEVRQVLRAGGRFTASDQAAAAFAVLGQLAGSGDDAAALTFYIAGADAEHAGKVLQAFVAAHLEELGRWLDGLRTAR